MTTGVILGVLAPPAIVTLGIISTGALIFGILTYPYRRETIIHKLKIDLKTSERELQIERIKVRELLWERNMRDVKNHSTTY